MTAFTKRPLATVAVAEGVGLADAVAEAVGEALALGLETTSVGLARRGSSTMAAITRAAAAAARIAPRFMSQ